MKDAAKYTVLALGPIALIVGLIMFFNGNKLEGVADSVLYYNVLTGEVDSMSVKEAGASVRRDDQNRKVIFMMQGEDGENLTSSAGVMYIRDHDRIVLDRLIEDGTVDVADLKVDPKTYRAIQ